MCQAIDEMLEEERNAGIEAGTKTGTERVNLLMQKLLADERFEDLQKSVVNPEFQHELMLEYRIVTEESSDSSVENNIN